MSCYIVTWQIALPANREKLLVALKDYKTFCPITDTSWAIVSEFAANDIRDKLMALLPITDKIFVLRSGTAAAWRGLPQANTDWLKKYL